MPFKVFLACNRQAKSNIEFVRIVSGAFRIIACEKPDLTFWGSLLGEIPYMRVLCLWGCVRRKKYVDLEKMAPPEKGGIFP